MGLTDSVQVPVSASRKGILAWATDVAALSHIFNGVGSAAGVGIGFLVTAWYAHEAIVPGICLAAVLATLCISNGGFIVNDIQDLPIDRINRPDRPLAAGRLSVTLAWIMYALYTLLGLILGLTISPATALLGLAIAAGLLLYSLTLKKRFLVGHLLIASLGAVLIPFGGLAEGHLIPTLFTVPMTFCAFAAREILKTIPDADGDRANGVENLTTRYGPRTATRISQIMLIVCVLSLPLLRLVWPLNGWYLAGVLVIIYPLTLFFLVRLSRVPDVDYADVKVVLRLSKLLFLLFALVMLIGSL